MAFASTLFCVLVSLFALTSQAIRYQPTWESLDSRPLPSWYDESKLGIFIHWGVFSVPSYRSEWFWWDWKGAKYPDVVKFMQDNYKPDFTYADFAAMFTAEFYNADLWADLFVASGAQYIVFVSKHHEGYTNWPSKYSFNWNSMAVGPKRDIVGELATAIKNRTRLHFGLYHSLFEWFHPQYLKDKANNWTTNHFVTEKTMPELYELVNKYKPDIVWSDGDWEAPDTYWQSREFLAWLYNDSPVKDTVVTNDRWGAGVMCHHGGYYTCQDKYNPGTLQKHKFEDAMTIDSKSWGFRRRAKLSDFLTPEQLISTLVETVSCGGNLLMNVGPAKDGMITPIFQERLRQMGQWLQVNGASIYSTKPWSHQNDTYTPKVWYTTKMDSGQKLVFAIALNWPEGALTLGAPMPSSTTKVALLGYSGSLTWDVDPMERMVIKIPAIAINQITSKWAWVFVLTDLMN